MYSIVNIMCLWMLYMTGVPLCLPRMCITKGGGNDLFLYDQNLVLLTKEPFYSPNTHAHTNIMLGN